MPRRARPSRPTENTASGRDAVAARDAPTEVAGAVPEEEAAAPDGAGIANEPTLDAPLSFLRRRQEAGDSTIAPAALCARPSIAALLAAALKRWLAWSDGRPSTPTAKGAIAAFSAASLELVVVPMRQSDVRALTAIAAWLTGADSATETGCVVADDKPDCANPVDCASGLLTSGELRLCRFPVSEAAIARASMPLVESARRRMRGWPPAELPLLPCVPGSELAAAELGSSGRLALDTGVDCDRDGTAAPGAAARGATIGL